MRDTPPERATTAGHAHYVQTVEPLPRKTATLELDGRAGVNELAAAVEELIWQQT
ncbi:hypothetical protein GCM10022222_75930 [Amycolatopsis ultiminotia]|uniref:Adenylate kinase n=1 Tax=Amycolatopsis ultiminotia TaxID=543629 RepID=A0ABP6YBI1_9PSEU